MFKIELFICIKMDLANNAIKPKPTNNKYHKNEDFIDIYISTKIIENKLI